MLYLCVNYPQGKRMNLVTKITLAAMLTLSTAQACSEIFINKNGKHVVGRNNEFGANVTVHNATGYIGQVHTTSVNMPSQKIPKSALKTWTTKYGYVGRVINPILNQVTDGMNTEGVSIGYLFFAGTKYPTYNEKSSKKVLAFSDIGTYVLARAKSTTEAIKLLKNLQLVEAKGALGYSTDLVEYPEHISIRDKSGHSAIIEFIDGKTVFYEDAKNVMTNAPSYKWQLENAAQYSSLKTTNTKANPKFASRVINYDAIYNMLGGHKNQTAMLGLPADFTPPSRFVRATVWLDNMMPVYSSLQARAQARSIIDAIATFTVDMKDILTWQNIKDLDNGLYYYKDLYMYTGKDSLFAYDIEQGFTKIDLNEIDFTVIPFDQVKKFN